MRFSPSPLPPMKKDATRKRKCRECWRRGRIPAHVQAEAPLLDTLAVLAANRPVLPLLAAAGNLAQGPCPDVLLRSHDRAAIGVKAEVANIKLERFGLHDVAPVPQREAHAHRMQEEGRGHWDAGAPRRSGVGIVEHVPKNGEHGGGNDVLSSTKVLERSEVGLKSTHRYKQGDKGQNYSSGERAQRTNNHTTKGEKGERVLPTARVSSWTFTVSPCAELLRDAHTAPRKAGVIREGDFWHAGSRLLTGCIL